MISRSELEGLIVLGLEELRRLENQVIQGWRGGRSGLREVTASVGVLKMRTGTLEVLLCALEHVDQNSLTAA